MHQFFTKVGLRTYIFAVCVAFLAMLAIGAKGLEEIAVGLLVAFFHWPMEHDGEPISATGGPIGRILEGFEYLLLSPLAFVIIVSVGNYLQAILRHEEANHAEHRVHRVKALIISLMISIVATHLVKRFVGQRDLQFDTLIFGSSLIVLFALYFALLLATRRIDAGGSK